MCAHLDRLLKLQIQLRMCSALQFRQQAVDLNSDNPSAIKLFVLTQAALIEKGHTQKQAYKIVEEEFSKAMTG